jgi:hypothetical protein
VWNVAVTFATQLPAGSIVNVLWKPLDSTAAWQSIAASAVGSTYGAPVTFGAAGGVYAFELITPSGGGWRFPDVIGETPYRVVRE